MFRHLLGQGYCSKVVIGRTREVRYSNLSLFLSHERVPVNSILDITIYMLSPFSYSNAPCFADASFPQAIPINIPEGSALQLISPSKIIELSTHAVTPIQRLRRSSADRRSVESEVSWYLRGIVW